MDFNKRMKKAKLCSTFDMQDKGCFVWCGTITKDGDKYYLYFSFWEWEHGFDAWVTHSKIGYAVSDSPTGPFEYRGVILEGTHNDGDWDRDCVHNPAVIKIDDTYYLYYMGNYGDGEFWNHRNHQRIGVAYSKNPQGPFKRINTPLLDVTEGNFDSLLVNNPTVCLGKDNKIYMMYKAVSDEGEMPYGGNVVFGIAVGENPLGPFKKHGEPLFTNPENPWSVEDPFMWYENDRFYAIAKDFQGYFTSSEKGSVALFESKDCFDWKISKNALAFNKEILWENGEVQKLSRMERPQMYIENGHPTVLCCACAVPDDEDLKHCFNVQIEIAKENEDD